MDRQKFHINTAHQYAACHCTVIQEAQLMLTNLRDTFRGQSRLPNMVPFGMLGMVSYYGPTVNMSVRRTVFEIFDFRNAKTLKVETPLWVTQGH